MQWRLVGPSLGVLAALGSERTSPYHRALHLGLFYSVLVTPGDPGEPHTVPAQLSGLAGSNGSVCVSHDCVCPHLDLALPASRAPCRDLGLLPRTGPNSLAPPVSALQRCSSPRGSPKQEQPDPDGLPLLQAVPGTAPGDNAQRRAPERRPLTPRDVHRDLHVSLVTPPAGRMTLIKLVRPRAWQFRRALLLTAEAGG